MSVRQQIIIWALVVFLLGLVIYILSPILLPFIAGIAIAYFLDPVADMLERWGLPRFWATVVILLVFVILFAVAVLTVFPLLISQLAQFIANLPDYLRTLESIARQRLDSVLVHIPGAREALQSAEPQSLLDGSRQLFSQLAQTLISGTSWLLNILSTLVIAPVVAFYLLRDWDRMLGAIDRSLPRDNAETIRNLAREMDEMLAGFIRGQGLVALILGTFYAASLSLIGLSFGLLIGIISGVLSFIPYVGSLTGFLLATGMAIIQFQDNWPMIVLTAGIFVFGQAVEGNFITPKIVGDRIRLHPVWMIFALVAFGYLLGFVGALIAMPVAAVVGVLVRFAMRKYYESDLYKGRLKQNNSS